MALEKKGNIAHIQKNQINQQKLLLSSTYN